MRQRIDTKMAIISMKSDLNLKIENIFKVKVIVDKLCEKKNILNKLFDSKENNFFYTYQWKCH